MRARWQRLRCKGLLGVWAVFLLMAAMLFAERSGIRTRLQRPGRSYLTRETTLTAAQVMEELPVTCLLVCNSEDVASLDAAEQFPQILTDMKVGFAQVDLAEEPLPALEGYRTVVVTLSNLSALGENVLALADWVEQGGRALFASALQKTSGSMLLEQKLGILSSDYGYSQVDNVRLNEDFMIGGGKTYAVTDGFDSAWTVELSERAEVFAVTDSDRPTPLVWRTACGEGTFVVVNLGFCEKSTRGFYAAAYSLLEPVCVWPVLDGATFYLDDFPSPVPGGDGVYLRRDYGTTVSEFYANIWWPDMLALAERYGFAYTGAVIENYGDDTLSEPERQLDVSRFQYFGNMLLRAGGEIGYHGYNHQPLCTGTTDYRGELPYHTWPHEAAMAAAMKELTEFVGSQFPEGEHSVYVPPSNVLSAEGRRLLGHQFPGIRTIASTYFADGLAYGQEFGVAEDGIVEQPRFTSGAVLDDYMKMTALSELNMHFVNNHFMHPDDLLDEDRGAALGWEELKRRLTEYMDWLYTAAPCIRRLTGSELSGAVQRYAMLAPRATRTGQTLTVELGHFVDEASLLVRLNEGRPAGVEGGELIPLTGTLYLLRAEQPAVTITLEND